MEVFRRPTAVAAVIEDGDRSCSTPPVVVPSSNPPPPPWRSESNEAVSEHPNKKEANAPNKSTTGAAEARRGCDEHQHRDCCDCDLVDDDETEEKRAI